jgi:hypothetical protein
MKKLRQFLHKNYPHVAGRKNNFSNHTYNPMLTPKHLYPRINIPQSTANLFTTVDALENLNIKYSVVFGTLLGIYRDGELIEHDTDSDLAIWLQDENKAIELIKDLEGSQLMLTRFDKNILSFTRGSDYIDLYMYRTKNKNSNILHCVRTFGTLTTMDFDNSNTITFHNRNLTCVNDPEDYFQKLYGSDWRVPIKDKHANINHGKR